MLPRAQAPSELWQGQASPTSHVQRSHAGLQRNVIGKQEPKHHGLERKFILNRDGLRFVKVYFEPQVILHCVSGPSGPTSQVGL